jgi:molybdate transport system permease protein
VLLSASEIEVLGLSLKVAFTGVVASLPVALALAYLLARVDFPGKILLDGIVHLPLVLPPVVIGYLLLVALGRNGLLGAWLAEHLGIVFAFRWTGAALAASVMGLPLAVRAMRQAIESVDRRLEAAASTLGAPPLAVFASVTLPLILPGVLNGMLLSFARSLGEFGATITFAGNLPGETRTLPLALFSALQSPGGEGPALRLAAISVAISLGALVASELLARRIARRVGRES